MLTLDDVQTGLTAAGFAGPVGPFADAANAAISAARGNWADAGINAVAIIPVVGDAAKAAKITADAVKVSKIDRAAFAAERKAFWKSEAKNNPDKYSKADLSKMDKGKPPTGSDGHPMELHHKDGTPGGGVEPMTRTEHRLGENYQKNHWWQFW